MADQRRHRLGREARPVGPAQLERHALAEMIGEHRHVALAMAKRRQGDDLERQPVEQIGAEPPGVDQRGQMLVGRRHDADIDIDRPRRADPRHLAIFDRTQQPLLRARR